MWFVLNGSVTVTVASSAVVWFWNCQCWCPEAGSLAAVACVCSIKSDPNLTHGQNSFNLDHGHVEVLNQSSDPKFCLDHTCYNVSHRKPTLLSPPGRKVPMGMKMLLGYLEVSFLSKV